MKIKTSPGMAWPQALLSPSPAWSAFLELRSAERLQGHEIREGQTRQMRALLRHCRDNVPYYRERRLPAPEEFELSMLPELPVLSRAALSYHLSDLTASRLPAGQYMTGSTFTSGSTGEPVEVKQTNVTELWYQAHFLRTLAWGAMDPVRKWAAIRWHPPSVAKELVDGVKVPHLDPRFAPFLESAPAYVMDISADPEKQLDWLCEVRPDYLVTYPSNLRALVDLHDARGRPLRLEHVLSLSEPLSDALFGDVFRSFGATVSDSYSAHEVGYIAGQCSRGRLIHHVFEENVILEVVEPETYEPLPPGAQGRVLLTALHNFASPLIRYDIGDVAALSEPKPCGVCGRELMRIEQLDGKVHPLFLLPDGTRKNSMQLAVAMRKACASQFRVTQKLAEGDAVSVQVDLVPGPGWGGDAKFRLLREFTDFFGCGIDVNIVEHQTRVPPGKAGKNPHLVTEYGSIR